MPEAVDNCAHVGVASSRPNTLARLITVSFRTMEDAPCLSNDSPTRGHISIGLLRTALVNGEDETKSTFYPRHFTRDTSGAVGRSINLNAGPVRDQVWCKDANRSRLRHH